MKASANAILSRHRGMPAQDGAGVKLTRIVNQPGLGYQDPFLMLDEFRSDDPNDYIAGFPPHPHRGFVTLTYMLAGQMEHKDSVGNTGMVSAGGAQWMKAARGIIHAEMPKQEDGLMWGFQLWINLPAKDKMSAAEWADYPAGKIPEYHADAVTVRVIAGELSTAEDTLKGPVQQPEQAFQMLDVRFAQGAVWQYAGQGQQTRLGYVYQGQVSVNGAAVSRGELVRLDADTELTLRSEGAAGMLLLAGQPIGEPVAQYGPFVMNHQAEIEQAIRDYQSGKLTA
ncbi:pirin family protein [Pseudidiomarina sp. 1APP75-32.1]|uniref:Pirin family protein n=1 Tax=Pseudidiomarina terrestris TaxID=2820060 RepID=A0AAW7QTF8_9GAMM|nr:MULTISPECIES: pirin family protein [unclassified Pseudidiomarina]MDN7123566.1 pirin family protein [Pseudidiomarina sp. 1APP75-32.1]MDN7126644.1 pirin family protein [Pseudidiomarina sp. 1APR75-33.1]MDN7128710.1 pirin family protein [Pseudidiomarina sp. 1APR75-15]